MTANWQLEYYNKTYTESSIEGFVFAVSSNLFKEAKQLLNEGIDVNHKKHASDTMLCYCAGKGLTRAVQFLLDNGADVNITGKNNMTPLMNACNFGGAKGEKIARILIEAGADVTYVNDSKETALTYSFAKCSRNLMQFLIDKGADVHGRSKEDFTPLMSAANENVVVAVDLLLEHGVDLNVRCAYAWMKGMTAEDIAKAQKRNKAYTYLKNYRLGTLNAYNDEIKYNDAMLSVMPEPYRSNAIKTVKPYIKIATKAATQLQLWQSKFAGNPYLPKGSAYPLSASNTPLILLAQINFAETPALSPFPKQGILQFFIADEDEGYGIDHEDKTNQADFRVIYYPSIVKDEATLTTDFAFLSESDNNVESASCALNFSLEQMPMTSEDYHSVTAIWGMEPGPHPVTIMQAVHQTAEETLVQYRELPLFDDVMHQIGGYPTFTQGDPRPYIALRNPERDLEKENWILLFQIHTDGNTTITWGDNGIANFFIKEADLIKADFTNIFFNWDCS